ncbi:IclR family transcriptional regulator [Leeia sp. TBRC 13508]|uniref:IclR family transcriptional regulator n=1 Tax=Leeia speluncae TaxID=2884804 RepID=A0ABS8D7K8_9NEIS|nr:IclR family transcriptional regulator [Leeia speluncae]MCB6184161.1 IclR family transcriptional regulator [Leeia speluncae]
MTISDENNNLEIDHNKDRLFVTALARGLSILESFKPGDTWLGNQELAIRTGLPKSTISRLTYTLLQLGYLIQDKENGRYRPGIAVLGLGYAALATQDIRSFALPLMKTLSEETGLSVTLAARSGNQMIYIEACRSAARLSIKHDIGSTVPLATTAIGRAWIAGLSESEQQQTIESLGLYYGEKWPAIHEGLNKALAYYAENGFTISLGEYESEIFAIGCPIRAGLSGQPHLSLNCSGPAYKLSKEILEIEIAPKLLKLVADLGGKP